MADTPSSTKTSSSGRPTTLRDFFSASSSKENAPLNIKSDLDKETKEKPSVKKGERQSCGARKPKANSKNDDDEDAAAEKPTKKKRKKPVPQPNGEPLGVYLQFNDGVEVVEMDLCTDIFDDSPITITLTGSFDSHSKRAATNFLSGFGRFVW